MKLRNKKTDAIVELVRMDITDDGLIKLVYAGRSGIEYGLCYRSLAELNDEWRDYTPRKPLIKDEKTRKAVRAWAEACCIEIVEITHSRKSFLRLMSAITGDDEICIDRDIGQTLDERVYNIDELCGEEEE